MSFYFQKKSKQNKTEWLLQQKHRVDRMIEVPMEEWTLPFKDVGKKLVKKVFLKSNNLLF